MFRPKRAHGTIPCPVVPDAHKIKQYLRLNNLSYLDFLLFQSKTVIHLQVSFPNEIKIMDGKKVE